MNMLTWVMVWYIIEYEIYGKMQIYHRKKWPGF